VRGLPPRRITPRDPGEATRRRRALGHSCRLPRKSLEQYTTGEAACATVVADEQAANGDSRLSNKEIADRAGVRYTTAANWRRKAIAIGDIAVAWRNAAGQFFNSWEKSLDGTKSMTSVVRFVGAALEALIRGGAIKNSASSKIPDSFFWRPVPP